MAWHLVDLACLNYSYLLQVENVIENLTMKKTWENANYPYLFFNEDGESVSSLGFYLAKSK